MQTITKRQSQRLESNIRDMNDYKELEILCQEFEMVLSRDFSIMNLEELKLAEKMFCGLAGMRDHRETISPTESQRKARDYLWFRITQEENKDDSVKIGDIFHTSWGYEQTNTEYFKVVEISKTGKTCKVVQIGFETVPGSEGFMCDSITPIPENILKDGQTCTVKITRSSSFNPYTKKHESIGEIYLRGSVFFSHSEDKHLQNVYRVDPTSREYRSWYA